ncbi:tetratricopeptide repeat protein [Planktomarina temperata]|nr:tetratricopeptide repeat protein [Planktomarina temperata]
MKKLTIDQALQQGIEAHKAGRVQEADRLYTAILKAQPKHPDANHNMGILAVGVSKVEQALPFFKTALEANPATAQFWLSYIDTMIKLERLADAKAMLDQAKSKGAKGDGFDQLEKRLRRAGQGPLEANQISSEPQPKQSNILDTLKLDQALKMAKTNAKKGDLEEAKRIYQDILVKFPKNKQAGDGLKGLTGKTVGRASKVQSAPKKELQLLINLHSQGRLKQALQQTETLVQKFPYSAELFNIQGVVFEALGQLDQSIEAYNKALVIKSNYAAAYLNMGNSLRKKRQLEEAVQAYEKALRIRPKFGLAHFNMGITFHEQGRHQEAILAYNEALTITPNDAEIYYSIGISLQEQGEIPKAIEAYTKALAIKPEYDYVRSKKLHQQAHICDWDGIKKDRHLLPTLGTSDSFVSPFSLLALEDSSEHHFLRSKRYMRANHQTVYQQPRGRDGLINNSSKLGDQYKTSSKSNRIKVGYFSPIFHQNPVSILSARVFELHNIEKFEIFIFCYGKILNDQYTDRLKSTGANIIDVSEMCDISIANLAKATGIDIAIDFNGFMKGQRIGILAHRPAPVQINYLAYPGTTGADFIDYIIADDIIIPASEQRHYSEKIICLPDCYMPQDNTRKISQKKMTRPDCGLPKNGFIFCCFNNSSKVSSHEFDIWMRLLAKVDDSVLWLLKTNQWAEESLKEEARKRFIEPSRLVFAQKLPVEEHLRRLQLADLYLDTFNFNAHTAASDALWACVPLITKTGNSFSARVASSLLSSIELPELITTTPEEYEALALTLATDSDKYDDIRKKLNEKKKSAPLFDSQLYTENLEKAYTQAYQRCHGNLPPIDFTVQ